MAGRSLPGVNIQYPISQEILEGRKIVETRTYPLPSKYKEQPILVIETPGPRKGVRAKIAGVLVFETDFKYRSKKEFYEDIDRHLVSEDSPWKWQDKPKWGWAIARVLKFKNPPEMQQPKGIRFTERVQLPASLSREVNLFLKSVNKLD